MATFVCAAIVVRSTPWWHSGQDALGRTRSSCEDGDAVVTRNHGVPQPNVSYLDDSPQHVDRISRPIRIKGLPADPKVVVKPSTLPGAGLGLFAAKDLVTFANRVSRTNAHKFKIAPYLGDSSQVIGEEALAKIASDYIISVNGITVDSGQQNSCHSRFSNDLVCVHKETVRVLLIDGVPWLVPLENVEILEGQEIFISYD